MPIDKERLKELNLVYDENTKQVTAAGDAHLNDIHVKVNSSTTSSSSISNFSNSSHSNYSLVDALNNSNNNNNNNNGQENNNNNDKEALKDYLNRFDSFINESKLKLKSLETSSK